MRYSEAVMLRILILLQVVHVAFLWLHDWTPLRPFNDVEAARKAGGASKLALVTAVSSAPSTLGLIFSLVYLRGPLPYWLLAWLWGTYGLLFAGAIRAWWWPYLIRPDPKRASRHTDLFGRTHRFLPVRNGVAPDTLHVTYHLLIAATLVILAVVTEQRISLSSSPP
jgi:hypothetical protein